jgi:hypothetical protein
MAFAGQPGSEPKRLPSDHFGEPARVYRLDVAADGFDASLTLFTSITA